MKAPTLWIITGPPGSGKTLWATAQGIHRQIEAGSVEGPELKEALKSDQDVAYCSSKVLAPARLNVLLIAAYKADYLVQFKQF